MSATMVVTGRAPDNGCRAMADRQINIVSWHRYLTRGLVVAPELLGLSHEFTYKSGSVKIELPSGDALPKKVTDTSMSEPDDAPVTVKGYRKQGDYWTPTQVSVKSVDAQVDLSETVTLPEEVMTRHPNPVDLVSREQQARLNQMTESYWGFADEAFDRWVRTLRWKSGQGWIARPEIHGSDSGWGTCLLDRDTKRRLWRSGVEVTMHMHSPITLPTWNDVEAAIKQGHESPVYVDSMFDGIEQFKADNLQLSVVYLAVACEAFMRARVVRCLPTGLSPAAAKFLSEAPIAQVRDHLFKDTLDSEQKKALAAFNTQLRRLFEARNRIVHWGHKPGLTEADCRAYIKATEKLIALD